MLVTDNIDIDEMSAKVLRAKEIVSISYERQKSKILTKAHLAHVAIGEADTEPLRAF
jgi:hypothetical protein